VGVWADPSLFVDPGGEQPDGFSLAIGSARSITQLDYFNGDLPIDMPRLIVVGDEVVQGAMGGG